jgi:hypothetical protein
VRVRKVLDSARNQCARWPTPWHVVFCENMKIRRGAPDGSGSVGFPVLAIADSRGRRKSRGALLAPQPGLPRLLHSFLQYAALRCEDPTHRKATLVQQIGQGGVLGGILLDGLRIEIDNPQRKGE